MIANYEKNAGNCGCCYVLIASISTTHTFQLAPKSIFLNKYIKLSILVRNATRFFFVKLIFKHLHFEININSVCHLSFAIYRKFKKNVHFHFQMTYSYNHFFFLITTINSKTFSFSILWVLFFSCSFRSMLVLSD